MAAAMLTVVEQSLNCNIFFYFWTDFDKICVKMLAF